VGQSQTVPQTPVTDAGGNLVIAGIIVVVLAVAAAVIVGRKSFRGKAKKTPAKTA